MTSLEVQYLLSLISIITIITSRQQENDGLTVPLTAFYAASLVLALSHIHKQGIVFRDLKPENIMLDNTGYLRGEVEVEVEVETGIDAQHSMLLALSSTESTIFTCCSVIQPTILDVIHFNTLIPYTLLSTPSPLLPTTHYLALSRAYCIAHTARGRMYPRLL